MHHAQLSALTPARYLSTPLRPILSRNEQPQQPSTPASVASALLTATKKTPGNLRWPLYTFLKKLGVEPDILAEAKSLSNGLKQQLALAEVLKVEDALTLTRHSAPNRSTIAELRRMYLMAVIKAPHGSDQIKSLRNSLLQSHRPSRQPLTEIFASTALLEGESEQCDESSSVSSAEDIQGETLTFSDDETEEPKQAPQPRETAPTSPGEETTALVCVSSGPPSEYFDSASTSTVDPGETPLDVLKCHALGRARISLLKDLIACEPTPIRLEVQRRISHLPTPKRPLEKPVSDANCSSKRRRCTEVSTDATTLPELSSYEENEISLLSANYPMTPASKIRPSSISTTAPSTDVFQSEECPSITITAQSPQKAAPAVPKRRAGGSSTLLGVKPSQAGKRYQSRVAINAKQKQTREKRLTREANLNALEAEKVDEEPVANETYYARRKKRFEKCNASKFVSTGIEWTEVFDKYKEQMNGDARHSTLKSLEAVETRDEQLDYIRRELMKCDSWRPGQSEVLSSIVSKESNISLLALPTGAGKSLVFQVCGVHYALAKKGLTVVVCPTTSLLNDQSRFLESLLKPRGLNVACVHSGNSWGSIRGSLAALADGLIDFLFTTPEQFISYRLRDCFNRPNSRPISLLVLDEAHCLSEWGHSFRPAYQRVLSIAQEELQLKKILLMTATCTKSTVESIKSFAAGEDFTLWENNGYASVLRDDLDLKIVPVAEKTAVDHHQAFTTLFANQSQSEKTIITFTWMKYQAEKIASSVKALYPNETTVFYHSGLDADERNRIEKHLAAGKCRFVVSTQALGLGVNTANVSSVIHYNMPAGLEQYIQEVGRANREKNLAKATCGLILDPLDYRQRAQQIAASVVDNLALQAFSEFLKSPIGPTMDLFSLKLPKNSTIKKELAGLCLPRKHDFEHAIMTNSSQTVELTVHPSQNETKTILGHPMLIVLDRERLAQSLNVRSHDELSVIATMLRNGLLRSTLTLPTGSQYEKDGNTLSWMDVINFWRAESTSYTQGLNCFECSSAGLELRFFDKPLEALAENSALFKFVLQRCGKQSGPVYKILYHDLFVHGAMIDFVDIDLLFTMLQELSQELRYSVKPLTGSKRVIITSIRPTSSQDDWNLWQDTLLQGIINPLKRNNKIEANRLDAAWIAFNLGGRKNQEPGKMLEFIEEYFQWDTELEKLSSKELWDTIGRSGKYKEDFYSWITEPFATRSSEVELAGLKFDIDRLCSYAQDSKGVQVLSSSGSKNVDALEVLRGNVFTPISAARILCGVKSLSFNHTHGAPGWNKYNDLPFSRVLQLCNRQTMNHH